MAPASAIGIGLCVAACLWWFLQGWREPAAQAASPFAVIALALGDPAMMNSPFDCGRHLTPMVAWVLWESLRRRNRWIATGAAAVCAGTAMFTAKTALDALRALFP
jgi:hypothetical protein